MQSVYLCLGGGTAEKGRRRVWNIVVLWREREVVERERERERGEGWLSRKDINELQ
jgi:hypothetical protein